MDESINITKAQLRQALYNWETAFRNGETETDEQRAAATVGDVAQRSSEYLFEQLKGLAS